MKSRITDLVDEAMRWLFSITNLRIVLLIMTLEASQHVIVRSEWPEMWRWTMVMSIVWFCKTLPVSKKGATNG